MIVEDPKVIIQSSGLKSVTVKEGSTLVLELKNATTLECSPIIGPDNQVRGYEFNYLSGKDNKKIVKLQEKILQIHKEIEELKISEVELQKESDNEEIEEENEEEENEED